MELIADWSNKQVKQANKTRTLSASVLRGPLPHSHSSN